MSKVLIRQGRGETVFGHKGMKRRPLVLFADRGRLSNLETLLRLGIKPTDLPMDHIRSEALGLDAVQEVITFIEGYGFPDVVFVEAADNLVEDGNKPQFVVPFIKGLQRVAEHYHCAIILSVGAPKTRNGDKHTAQRDRILGSEKWARCAEDVLTLEFVSHGNGTENTRTLTVQHRNAPAETFALTFAPDGSELVETAAEDTLPDVPLDQDSREVWMQTAGRFTCKRFRDECGRNNNAAKAILAGLVRENKLTKHRDGTYSWKKGDRVPESRPKRDLVRESQNGQLGTGTQTPEMQNP